MDWVHQPAASQIIRLVESQLGTKMPEWCFMPVMLLAIIGFVCLASLVLVWAERKVSARIQNRVGPMLTGPKSWAQTSMWFGGVFQTAADAIKLLTKELIIPTKTDAFPFALAPILIVAVCITAFVVIPFAPALSVSDLNIGIVHIVSISSLTVLSIIMAGWSSNSKYSLLGGLRSAAQMLSYEIPLIFSLLGPIVMAGTLSMQGIVKAQAEMGLWFAGPSFIGLIVYYISSIAEVNRPPFDIPEAESELVAGYVSEYSGMMFSMFFLAEFANMFLVCAVAATVFLGGWAVPFMAIPKEMDYLYMALGCLTFFIKTGFLVFVMMWVRWTFPRVRPDHLMNLGWKYLFPLSLVNLAISVAVTVLRLEGYQSPWIIAAVSLVGLLAVMAFFSLLHQPKPHQSTNPSPAPAGLAS